MKILYAIQSTGSGHISRAQHLLPKFKKRVRVDVVLSGPKTEIPLGSKIIYHYQGITFIYRKNGAINWPKTLLKNNIFIFFYEVLKVPVKNYDLVINDFEPVTAWACYLRGVKCVAISNQYSLLTKGIPKPKKIDAKAIGIIRYFAPVKKGYGFHFKKYNPDIYYPIIRKKVQQLVPEDGDAFLVYLPSYNYKYIVKILEQLSNHKWIVFNNSIKKSRTHKNIRLQPIHQEKFLKALAKAKGIVCTAGFTLPSEALYLQKPLLAIPLKTQLEQEYNAAALKEMGVATLKKFGSKQLNKIRKWAENPKAVPYHYKDESDQLIERVLLDYIKSLISLEQIPT